MRECFVEADSDRHDVQQKVRGDEHNGYPDRFLKSANEYGTEQRDQDDGDHHRVFKYGETVLNERIFQGVGTGISGRKRDGYDEIGGDKAEQHKYE